MITALDDGGHLNIQGSIDWQIVIGACVTVGTALLNQVMGLMAEYINGRKNRNSWDNILKEIDVFNRWIDEGRIETIDKLYYHIEESINERFKKRGYPAYLLLSAAGALFDIWYVIMAVLNHEWLLCAISALSLLCIVLSAVNVVHENAKREKDRKAAAKACVDSSIKGIASHIRDAQTEEEKLVRLERNDDIDSRWVAHLSRGSVYNRRVFSEYQHAAREKAEDMELERLVDQVMQLPTEPPIDER